MTGFDGRSPGSGRAGQGPRFELVMEPSGRFSVFEAASGLPAEIDRRPLIGLEEGEAATLCRFLNTRPRADSVSPPFSGPRRGRRWPPRVSR